MASDRIAGRTRDIMRPAFPTLGTLRRGTNFSGGIIQALRSLLLRNPLIPLCQEPTSGSLKCFVFSPIMSAPFFHENDHGRRNGQSAVKG